MEHAMSASISLHRAVTVEISYTYDGLNGREPTTRADEQRVTLELEDEHGTTVAVFLHASDAARIAMALNTFIYNVECGLPRNECAEAEPLHSHPATREAAKRA